MCTLNEYNSHLKHIFWIQPGSPSPAAGTIQNKTPSTATLALSNHFMSAAYLIDHTLINKHTEQLLLVRSTSAGLGVHMEDQTTMVRRSSGRRSDEDGCTGFDQARSKMRVSSPSWHSVHSTHITASQQIYAHICIFYTYMNIFTEPLCICI